MTPIWKEKILEMVTEGHKEIQQHEQRYSGKQQGHM